MGDQSPADGSASGRDDRDDQRGRDDGNDDSGRLIIAGLGPGSLARVPAVHRSILEDAMRTVVLRTLHHPAAEELATVRSVVTCDDLYEADSFGDVYEAIVDRVLSHAASRPTVYAVPGSPMVGEFAVRRILEMVPGAQVLPAESFVDAVLRVAGYDPFDRGLRLINGHELPDPFFLDAPAIIGHLDRPEVLADVAAALGRVLPDGAEVMVCANLGAMDEEVVTVPIDRIPARLAGFRTSMFVDTDPAGLYGLIAVSRRLRAECPWDRGQTHHSLVRHLVEEAYELIEAISSLPPEEDPIDFVAYDGVEEELGDVLLQVLFHAAIASERGVFGIDDVATRLREKLVRRHPHVFGDVEVADADEVASNWERIKRDEKAEANGSRLDGIPAGLPALERAETVQRRAAEVGFDWERESDIVEVLRAEVEELSEAMAGTGDPADELGDVLFTAINLLRRLDLSGEEALRAAVNRFERRFRTMERGGDLTALSLEELEERWQAAKRQES